jgi:hypothetical protein
MLSHDKPDTIMATIFLIIKNKENEKELQIIFNTTWHCYYVNKPLCPGGVQ